MFPFDFKFIFGEIKVDMSDSFISLIPAKESWEDAEAKAKEIVDWLIQLEVIRPERTPCGPEGELAYPPHQHCHKVLQHFGDDDFLNLTENGLEVTTDRNLFMTWDGYEKIICPECNNDVVEVEDEIQMAIGEWLEGGEPIVECPKCHGTSPVGHYRFYEDDFLAGAISNLGFTFWNWSEFSAEFLSDFEVHLGSSLKVIYG